MQPVASSSASTPSDAAPTAAIASVNTRDRSSRADIQGRERVSADGCRPFEGHDRSCVADEQRRHQSSIFFDPLPLRLLVALGPVVTLDALDLASLATGSAM